MDTQQRHRLNIIGSISHFFAVHRPLSLLLLLVTIIFGLIAFFLTPKQYNPEIVRPAFSVSIQYVGASQQEAVDRVVYELVEKIITVPGVDDVFTSVSDNALIQTTVIFEVGYDATKAKVDLLSQLQQHEYLAQGFIEIPQVIEINPETIPVLQIVFGSDEVGIEVVRKKVTELSHTLSNIQGVSAVEVIGGYAPSVQVELRPEVMAAQEISLSQVLQTIQLGQSRFVSQGFRTDQQTVSFLFDGRAHTIQQIGMLPVTDGVLLRDVATIYEGASKNRGYVIHDTKGHNGAEVVVLAVSKVEGASAPMVTKEVRTRLDTVMNDEAYASVSYQVVHDDGVTASKEIYGLTKNLVTSITIVVFVLLLFLSFRASMVVFIAIPVTLLIVFGIGYLFGQTINRITLFALILSLGLLVDSAIVVVENIHAHLLRVSKATASATREIIIAGAVHEIGIGLLLSAVTSVIVFLPMRYITGMMGPYMGPIAFFVPTALIVSLLVAVIVTPFVSSYLLKSKEKKNPLSDSVDRIMKKAIYVYQRVLSSILYSPSLQRKILLTAVVLFFVSVALPLFGVVHFQMLPRADRDQFYVYIDAPVDMQTEYTKTIAKEISSMMTSDNQVVSVQQYIAQAPALDFNGMFKGAQNRTQPYQATLRVNLTPTTQRKESSSEIVERLRTSVAEQYPLYAPMVRLMEEPPGPPVMATLVAKVSATNPETQVQFASVLESYFKSKDDVIDIYTSTDQAVGRVVYRFDHNKARVYGVSSSEVMQVLQTLSGDVFVTEYLASTAGVFTPIVLSFPAEYTDAPADITQLYVRSKEGVSVPISAVLEVSYQERPSALYFEHATPVTYVTGEVRGQPVIYSVIGTMYDLLSGAFAEYYVERWGLFSMDIRSIDGEMITLAWGGEWEMTLENFRDLGVAMGIALLLVYAVLVAQYNSFSKPAYILVTVPLGLVGILWGFLFLDTLFGITLTATALIGFIALIGLVVNNAIIFLEYVQQSQAKGQTLEESLLAAGSARLRPIFLTSLTTILGSLTIVNDPVWSGLAWSIIFGLSLSTVLTLVMYPTLLVFFHKEE